MVLSFGKMQYEPMIHKRNLKMNRLIVEKPDNIEAKLKEIANSTNSTVDSVVKDILENYTEEAYEDYLLSKLARERLKDLDKAVEVSLNELQ